MPSAVFTTGGKQYYVSEGDTVSIERLPAAEGQVVSFTDVLLTADDQTCAVGTPLLKGVVVEAKIVKHGLMPKLFGVKMKAKKRYRRLFGHRQPYTTISVEKIKTS
ncbi:MAG: 50S ribosomal protein L21 [Candidatus Andersenbacteria bacterium]|nr:50S ribosomal protein L21 [Candidatus Andersenbacteria bacterium]